MAIFKIAFDITVHNEQGYQCMESDSGNWCNGVLIGTNWGISAPVLNSHMDRAVTVADMKELSVETAMEIYKKEYWDKMRGDEIQDQELANKVFDGVVKDGIHGGLVAFQTELGITASGVMDAETLNTLNG